MENTEECIYTYYGRHNPSKKPKYGVHYLMLDDYIKETIEKQKNKFIDEVKAILLQFKKENSAKNQSNDTRIKESDKKIYELDKLIKSLSKLNNLKVSENGDKPKESEITRA